VGKSLAPFFIFGLIAAVLEVKLEWMFKLGIILAIALLALVQKVSLRLLEEIALPVSLATKVSF
jgi:hypothetical protein